MSIDDRLQKVENTLCRIEDTQNRIADSQERLVRLETMHAETRQGLDRAFKHTDKVAEDADARLKVIEERQPVTSLVVYTVGITVLGALAAMGAALMEMVGLGTEQ